MMCYRDRVFCAAPCNPAKPCDRMVTPEVEAAAERTGLPLSLVDLRLQCTRFIPNKEATP